MTWREEFEGTFSRSLKAVRDNVLTPQAASAPSDERVAELAKSRAPVIWLIGKVQSGKTSIVRALTGVTAAEVGQGYKPCTRTAQIFDFPSDAPVIRFLDTRGLGEAGYDPAEDIAVHESQAHLILAVMKALDPQQDAVSNAVKAARARHPGWPVVVAQTTLHDAYKPGDGHPAAYPYGEPGAPLEVIGPVPPDLARSLAHQRALFADLPGDGLLLFVPIDFTQPDDGFEPVNYGLPQLLAALEKAAPAGIVAALKDGSARAGDTFSNEAHPHIVGYSSAAAAADVVPLAGAVAVPAVQAKMLHSLARIYGVEWNRRTLSEFGACLGAGVVTRMAAAFGARQLAKLIPVYGQTAGAAAAAATSFATTFAIGKAACYFLARQRLGQSDPKGVAEAYAAALSEAFRFRKKAEAESKPEGAPA
ncbi:GTPase domain-containing protein [Rhodomicrobium vannielii ATCC 17100]|uniref:GTPase family protein n=1 Tax=Rhodomicrobium vannielii TaxID=1069 RepID=UPI0019184557|nr:GTPase domain-containing protein [Rhodomicrobium vannielii]MBJ7534614.1 GTPase domain-containing protein [Rhodomicrobium vannielii ATCC 17100]